MRTAIRRIGNSQGILIPKQILAQLGFTREVELSIEDDAVVLRRPARVAREGWAEASQAVARSGEDALAWPEFGNDDDASFTW